MKPLSYVILWVLSAMVFAVGPKSSAQATHNADVRELQRLETVWNEGHERGDADALGKLWADDMEVAVPRMPVLTKSEALKFARSGHMRFLTYRTSDVRVRVYDNAAIVTGRLQRTRSMNGQEISDDWRASRRLTSAIRISGAWFRFMLLKHRNLDLFSWSP